jgi:hypothetical protein
VGSLYHPGSSEKICDVRTRTDWVPVGSFLAELGVLVSRRAARRVAQTWNELEAPWPTRVAQLSRQPLVAFHNPSLIQHACRKAVDGVPHEARNFLRGLDAARNRAFNCR